MNWQIYMFIKCLISMFFLLLFIYLFLPLRYKKSTTIIIILLSFIFSSTVEYVQFIIYKQESYSLLATIINILIVQGTNLLLSYYRDFRGLFIGISATAYTLVGNVISMIVWNFTGSYIVPLVIQFIIHTIIITFSTILFKYKIHNELERHKKGWGPLCLIPALFYTTVRSLLISPESNYNTTTNSLAIIFTLLITSVSYSIIARLFYQQRKNDILERDNEFLETYSLCLRREIESTRLAEEKLTILRHDFKHTSNLIISYLKNNQTEQIYKLLNQINQTLSKSKLKIYCDNISLNSVITTNMLKVQENNIIFDIKVDVPQNLKTIDEFELATVLSNLLENAINATKKLPVSNRKIWLKLYPVKNQLLLDISNTFDGKCKISPNTGLPTSQNGEGHGYGLRSVKAYTEKWDAIFEYTIEENSIFHLKILTIM